MKLKPKAKVFIGIVVLLVVILGGLGVYAVFFKPQEKQEEESIPVVKEKQLQILDLNSKSRPVAVMINNLAAARPYHSGLQDAYLVYEIIVEGGITRLMAVYKDANVDKIGSIRSARHYFLDYALENDAIFVHWGFSDQASNDIKTLSIDNIDGLYYGNTYFWRDDALNVSLEHKAFTNTEKINEAINKFGYRNTTKKDPLISYSVDEIDMASMEGATLANNVSIKYSSSVTTSYEYDAESKTYKRSVNGQPHTDYITKEQYTAKNIITYQVNNTTISGDTKGRQNIDNIGSGEGYFISNGYAVPITWEKKSRSNKTIYKYKNGAEININDGNTYIQIQPVGQTLSIS